MQRFGGRDRSGQLSDPDEVDGADEVDEALRDADERADLADLLQASAVDRRDTGEVARELDRDGRAEHLADMPDLRGAALRHLQGAGAKRGSGSVPRAR